MRRAFLGLCTGLCYSSRSSCREVLILYSSQRHEFIRVSDLLALYDALAGSASIFIGILAALLVNRIISDENDRSQIRQRVDYINSSSEGLEQRRDEIDNRLEALFADEHKQNQRETANDYLDDFISKIRKEELEIDDGEHIYPIIADKFESFVGEDDWSDWAFQIALIERFNEISAALGKEDNAYEKQIGWEFRKLRQTLEQHQRGLILDQRVADRRSLNRELRKLENLYNRLDSRYEALNISKHRKLLGVLAAGLVLSVGVPLLTHAAHVVGPVQTSSTVAYIEPISVVVSWVVGLLLVIVWIFIDTDPDKEEELDDLEEVELTTFTEDLPNLIEIPDSVPKSKWDDYAKDRLKQGETVRYINEGFRDEEGEEN